MKEQEAQQAQTIADIKLWYSLGRSTMKSSGEVDARKKVSDLLEIVDSQAQKIARLTKERDEQTAAAFRIGYEGRQKIAELNPLPWKYCPECGNYESEHAAGFAETHRICRPCLQEWHIDIDYSDTIPKILSSHKRKIAEQNQLLENCAVSFKEAHEKIAAQTEKITELTGDCSRYDEAIMIQGKNAGKLRRKLSEQAKRIEILEKCYYAAMNRFAFDSVENRHSWYAAQNNKREFDKDLK